jgi:hypothetical protein
MYKTITTQGGESIIKMNDDGSTTSFAKNEANAEYQAYLKWLAEGNQPLPADEGNQ